MSIFSNDLSDPETQKELANFIKIFSFLGFIVLIVFGAQNYIVGNKLLGILEIAGSLVLGLNLVAYYALKNLDIARNLLLATIVAFLLLMLVTGGLEGTGIYWFYIFPVAAFFLVGRTGGVIWIGALFTATILSVILGRLGGYPIPYSNVEIRQMLISLFVVSLSIYIYQKSRETAHSSSRQNRQEFQLEHSRAEAIVENIGEGIVAIDQDGRVAFLNRAAENNLGWWQHDLLGKKFTDVVKIRNEDGKDIVLKEWPLAKNQKPDEHNILVSQYVRKDGTIAILEVRGAPIIIDGKFIGSVASLRDVGEERIVDRAKSEFMTVASHQLRTPISAISWFAEMLLNGDAGKLNAEQKDDVEQIYQSNQRMARLVGDMLIVSRLELGNLPVKPEPTNLSQLCHKILQEQLAPIPMGERPSVKENYDKAMPELQLDPEITRTVLHNIIGNAFKYTPKTGNVSVEVTHYGKKDEVGSKKSVSIIVSDSGYGIPKNAQGKIFSKFFRAENIRDKDTDGTGLGLYIVKALLDYVGGDISFTSEENQGTTFIIHLPAGGMKKNV